jgi:hypothetical protein
MAPAGALARNQSGLLGKLGKVLRGGEKAGEPPAPMPVDLTAYRRRALELLQRLQSAAGAERLTALGVLAVQLRALIEDLHSTVAPEADIRPLEELLKELQALLATKQPSEKAVAALWSKAEATLKAFGADTGETKTAPRRAAFWK